MNHKSVAPFIRPFLLVAGLSLTAGCGGNGAETFPVDGQVVFADGSPLSFGGRVIFLSTNLSPPVTVKGYFEEDGKFQLTLMKQGERFLDSEGTVAGEYQVAVLPEVPEDRGTMSQAQYFSALEPIQERYTKPRSSGLQFTVSPDTAPHTFRIEVHRSGRRRSRRGG